MPVPPCEPLFQVMESGRDGENLEKLSMETTVLNVHYVIHITDHVTFYRRARVIRESLPVVYAAAADSKTSPSIRTP